MFAKMQMWTLCALVTGSTLATAFAAPPGRKPTPVKKATRPAEQAIVTDKGSLVDIRTGQIAARHCGEQAAPSRKKKTPSSGSPDKRDGIQWDTLTPLPAPTASWSVHTRLYKGNVPDSNGNRDIWFFQANKAYCCSGHGSFENAGNLGLTISPIVHDPWTAVIDYNDNIMLFAENIDGSLKMVRHTPDQGWEAPIEMFQGEVEYLNAAVDHNNNVILVMDGAYRIYDAAGSTWSDLQSIPFLGGRQPKTLNAEETTAFTLVSDSSGTVIYLVYLLANRQTASEYPDDVVARMWPWQHTCLCVNRYNVKTQDWSRAEVIPNTWNVTSDETATPLLATVDDNANLTIIWSRCREGAPRSMLCASQLIDGAWQPTHEFGVQGGGVFNMQRFSDIDVNPAGDVLATFLAKSTSHPENHIVNYYSVHYRPDKGWDRPQTVYGTSDSPWQTRIRCRFYQGNKAVATLNTMDDYEAGRTAGYLYNGTSWLADPLYTAHEDYVYFHELESDNGEALWLFQDKTSGLLYSAWLRQQP